MATHLSTFLQVAIKDNDDLYRTVLQDIASLYSKYGVVFSGASGDASNTYSIRDTNQRLTLEQAQDYVLKQLKKGGK